MQQKTRSGRRRGNSILFESLEQRRLLSGISLTAPGKPHIKDPTAVGANDVTWTSSADKDAGTISYTLWYRRSGSGVQSPAGTTTGHSLVLNSGVQNNTITPDTMYATWVVATDESSGVTRSSNITRFRTASPLTPAAIRKAYGINQLYKEGYTGKNEVIGLVEMGGDPTLGADVDGFDALYHLKKPQLAVIPTSTDGSTSQPTDTDHAHEISLDVEWAHAIAPDASIIVVEGKDNFDGFLLAAQTAAKHASVVSMSYAYDENFFLTNNLIPVQNYDSNFQFPDVTFVAAAGDYFGVPEWPSISSDVLSVGGTLLSTHPSIPSQAQVVWHDSILDTPDSPPSKGSGTGFGQFSSTADPSGKQTPDVSYAADGYAWFYQGNLNTTGYGTSFGSPQWAALIAIADQGRKQHGLPVFNSSAENSLSPLLQSALNGAPAKDFGLNSASSQQPAFEGNNFQLGLGTPTGALVNYLIKYRG